MAEPGKKTRRRATPEERHDNAERARRLIADGSSSKQDAFAQVASDTGFSAASIRNHYQEFFGDEEPQRRGRRAVTTRSQTSEPASVTDEAVAQTILARYRSLDGDRSEYERQIEELRARIEAIEPTRARLRAAAEALGIELPAEREYEREPFAE